MSEWIRWNGGICPVQKETVVDVRWRDGGLGLGKCSDFWAWDHQNGPYDIVAYRIIKEGEE